MPLVLVQIIATWVFYARHWETVSRRLSADVAGDIGHASSRGCKIADPTSSWRG